MEPTCYLFTAHGWLSRTGQYVTDISQARSVGLTEARELCSRHQSRDGYGMVPVRTDDLPEAL